MTFIRACRWIENYSAGHESRVSRLGADRFAYPPHHIEADNRLSWLLGRLDRAYGDRAAYLHLRRERNGCAASFSRREGLELGIIRAYRQGILMGAAGDSLTLAEDYLETVDRNIELFLKDKSRVLPFALEEAESDFRRFWHWIGAEGDLNAALREWQVSYNASPAV